MTTTYRVEKARRPILPERPWLALHRIGDRLWDTIGLYPTWGEAMGAVEVDSRIGVSA